MNLRLTQYFSDGFHGCGGFCGEVYQDCGSACRRAIVSQSECAVFVYGIDCASDISRAVN